MVVPLPTRLGSSTPTSKKKVVARRQSRSLCPAGGGRPPPARADYCCCKCFLNHIDAASLSNNRNFFAALDDLLVGPPLLTGHRAPPPPPPERCREPTRRMPSATPRPRAAWSPGDAPGPAAAGAPRWPPWRDKVANNNGGPGGCCLCEERGRLRRLEDVAHVADVRVVRSRLGLENEPVALEDQSRLAAHPGTRSPPLRAPFPPGERPKKRATGQSSPTASAAAWKRGAASATSPNRIVSSNTPNW